MSHITCQAQRDENEAIRNCPHASVSVYKEIENEWTGEMVGNWYTEDQCGPTRYVSTAQDQCIRCGKTFTY